MNNKPFKIIFLLIFPLLILFWGCRHKGTANKIRHFDGFTEKDVCFYSLDFMSIYGTITKPDNENIPAAVIILAGSGAMDRDGSIGQNKVYQQLAHGLARNGILTLRFDKRAYAHEKIIDPSTLTMVNEYLFDSLAAVNYVKEHYSNIHKIFILGHSLGAIAAVITAKMTNIDGLILIGIPYSPYFDVIIRQFKFRILFSKNKDEKNDMDEIIREFAEANAKIKSGNTKFVLLDVGGAYWSSLDYWGKKKYNLLSELSIPILMIQGQNDCNVFPDEFDRWIAFLMNHKNVYFKLYPKLNHFLLPASKITDIESSFNKNEIPNAVIDDITNFILQQK